MQMYPKWLAQIILIVALSYFPPSLSSVGPLKTVLEWHTVDYTYPSSLERSTALATAEFIPTNIVILDADTHVRGAHRRVFVTTPRLKPGTPATLSVVAYPGTNEAKDPPLSPYPSWDFNQEGNCDGLSSVFRIKVDTCGRLWVVDTGTVDAFIEARRICPPQLYVFDLNDNTVLWRHRFPKSVVTSGSLLVNIAVDIRGSKCDDAFAYISDVTEPALVVVDAKHDRSWRVVSNLMYPYPLHGTFNLNGVSFDLMDGILGLALGPTSAGDRKLFFHSLASVRESWVRCSLLRNESNFPGGLNEVPRQFHVSSAERPSQSAAEDMDAHGIMIFGLLQENALACWDSRRQYSPENIHIVSRSERALQFPSGVKISHDRTVWVSTSRFQNYMIGNIPLNEVNYRVLMARMDELVRGTPCDINAGLGAFAPGFSLSGLPSGHNLASPLALTRPPPLDAHGFGIFHGPSLGSSPSASTGSGTYRTAPREPPGFSLPILFPDDGRLVG